jgi:toxin CcdB
MVLTQYDVVKNPSDNSAKRFPFLLILQTDFLNEIDTVIVAPLRLSEKSPPPRLRLNPVLDIQGRSYQLMPELMTSMQRLHLKKHICSVAPARDEIRAAIDFLFVGF